MGITTSNDLDKWQEELEKSAFQSPEYLAAAKQLVSRVADVRDRIIACGVEGTLLSKNLRDTVKKAPFSEDRWVRRPLAAELVSALEKQNTVIMWSSMGRDILHQALKSAHWPEESRGRLVSSDEFVEVIEAKVLDTTNGKSAAYEKAVQSHRPVALQRGQIKFPHLLPADVLIDDEALDHAFEAGSIFGMEERNRYLHVKPAIIPSLDQFSLDAFTMDRGLLGAAKTLADFFKQS